MYKKERKGFFNNRDPSFVTDKTLFWKTVKLSLSNKGNYDPQIRLLENDELLQDNNLIAKELNEVLEKLCLH